MFEQPKWIFKNCLGDMESRFNERKRGFWLVWCPGKGEPTKSHDDCQSARNEAMRLAEENSGESFMVLRADSEFAIKDKTAIIYQ